MRAVHNGRPASLRLSKIPPMPVHRIKSGPAEDDLDVLVAAVKKIEAKGEELVGNPDWRWLNYPIGEWVIVTRKIEQAASREHARAEKRAT